MSVGLLCRYIDDLIAGREQDIDVYLQGVPAGAEDVAPLLLMARVAYKAIQAVGVDPARQDESRNRAQQAMGETLGPGPSVESPSSPAPRP
jgi:hypothetical protein